jgi:hypothetical protein
LHTVEPQGRLVVASPSIASPPGVMESTSAATWSSQGDVIMHTLIC